MNSIMCVQAELRAPSSRPGGKSCFPVSTGGPPAAALLDPTGPAFPRRPHLLSPPVPALGGASSLIIPLPPRLPGFRRKEEHREPATFHHSLPGSPDSSPLSSSSQPCSPHASHSLWPLLRLTSSVLISGPLNLLFRPLKGPFFQNHRIEP